MKLLVTGAKSDTEKAHFETKPLVRACQQEARLSVDRGYRSRFSDKHSALRVNRLAMMLTIFKREQLPPVGDELCTTNK